MSPAPRDPQELLQFRDLVEQLPAIVYVDVPDLDETLYISPQIEALLGITPKEWIESNEDLWAAHLHPADRDVILSQYSAYLAGGPDVDDYRMVARDGRVVWIHDRASLIQDAQGRTIEQGVMFDITDLKEAQAIIAQQMRIHERVDAIGRDFTDILLRGEGIPTIAKALATIAECPVAVEDVAHQLVEVATFAGSAAEVIDTWEAHSRTGHDGEEHGVRIEPTGVGTGSDGPRQCAWIPIWLRNEAWGRLHLLEGDSPLDEIDLLALDRAGAAIGLALLGEREAADLAERAGSALVFDVLQGRSAGDDTIRRAKSLGARLDEGRQLTAIAVEVRTLDRVITERGLSDRERQRFRTHVLADTRDAFGRIGASGLAGIEGNRVLAIVGIPAERNPREALEGLAAEIANRTTQRDAELIAVVGASIAPDPVGLRRALEEATEAAAYGARTSTTARAIHFTDLGIHHLLVRLADGPELARFVESALEPLLAHDAKSSSPLLPTLRAFLDAGGRKVPAAKALHIERRSLYHRMARIQKLLDRDVEDPDARVQLEIAMRGLDLLRDRARP